MLESGGGSPLYRQSVMLRYYASIVRNLKIIYNVNQFT